jgi:hypothetical protein
MEFHPEGTKEVEIHEPEEGFVDMKNFLGDHLRPPRGSSSSSKNSKDNHESNDASAAPKERNGIYRFLKRQLSNEKLQSTGTATVPKHGRDEHESDIESMSGSSSSSFAPDTPFKS